MTSPPEELWGIENPRVVWVDELVMGSMMDYERNGDVGYVVFPCGYTIGDDGDTLNLYYGAADTSVCLARGSIREMLAWLKESTATSRNRTYHDENGDMVSHNDIEM